jgi:phthalate 4,5-cis-dihydrodiol dehydrogenase
MSTTQRTTPTPQTQKKRVLKMGMVGIGVGGTEMLPAFEAMPEISLVAGADINPRIRQAFSARYEVPCYSSVEEMCRDSNVEAVWVSTPNRFHAPHTIIAADHGKHVVVEKPMALNLKEAAEMIEACKKNGVILVAGHTRSFTPPVRAMRRMVASGELGKVRAINLFAFTDWLTRPRTAEELDPAQGGGLVYRQGPHQVDSVRLIGGGLVRSLRAHVSNWMPGRPIDGYYAAFMEFEDGTPATIVHNGNGLFLASELVPWGTDKQRYTPEERIRIRKALRAGTWDDEAEKQTIRIGGLKERTTFEPGRDGVTPQKMWVPEDLGIMIVTCERGDMRHSPYGIFVYDDNGKREIQLRQDKYMGGLGTRRAELEDLYNAVVLGEPVLHTGEWGMGTLEVCLAMKESSEQRREVRLSHQVPIHPEYDQRAKVYAQWS